VSRLAVVAVSLISVRVIETMLPIAGPIIMLASLMGLNMFFRRQLMSLSVTVPWEGALLALPFFILSRYFSPFDFLVRWAVAGQLTMDAVLRDSFWPYSARMRTIYPPSKEFMFGVFPLEKREGAMPPPEAQEASVVLPHRTENEFYGQRYWKLLGFSLPVAALVSLPVIGFVNVGFAHAAAAHVLAKELRTKSDYTVPQSSYSAMRSDIPIQTSEPIYATASPRARY